MICANFARDILVSFHFVRTNVPLPSPRFFFFFERNTVLSFSLFLTQLRHDQPTRLVNPHTRPALSAVPSGGTHVRVHVGIRRAPGAGPEFSRNDQRESNYACVSTDCSLRNRKLF